VVKLRSYTKFLKKFLKLSSPKSHAVTDYLKLSGTLH